MSRRKQQNPKPLVALKQAEDEAEKQSRCVGSMIKSELLEEAEDRDGELVSRAGSCGDPSSSNGSPDPGISVDAASGETIPSVTQDIVKIIRIEGEYRVLSRTHISARSGCGPFRARLIPRESIEGHLERGAEENVLKLLYGECEHWFLLETNDGQWLRYLGRPKPGQEANVIIHFVGGLLWIEVAVSLQPDSQLVAELSRDPLANTRSEPRNILREKSQGDRLAVSSVREEHHDSSEDGDSQVTPAEKGSYDEPTASGGAMGDKAPQLGTAVSPFVCPACGVTFRSQRTLAAHEAFYCGKAVASSSPREDISSLSSRSPTDVKPSPPSHISHRQLLVAMSEATEKTAEVFQCQICKHVTCSWNKMCVHLRRDHTPPGIAQPCGDSFGGSSGSATAAAATSTEVTTLITPAKNDRPEFSSSYCINCDIQFMSAENYDVHRQHYCGSRRGRVSMAGATTLASAPLRSVTDATPSRTPSPQPQQPYPRRHARPHLTDDTGKHRVPSRNDRPTVSHWNANFEGSPHAALPQQLRAAWVPEASSLLAAARPPDSVTPHRDGVLAGIETTRAADATISIPALLSLTAPRDDVGVKNGHSNIAGKLFLGSQSSAADEGVASVTLEVPASVVHRAMATTAGQQRRSQEYRDVGVDAVSAEPISQPVPSAHRDGPLDLSMKCLKRKCQPHDDCEEEEEEELRLAKTPAVLANRASLVGGAHKLPGGHHGGGAAAAALLSKCVECNILFYKHENYMAHKMHYCPARHKEGRLGLRDSSVILGVDGAESATAAAVAAVDVAEKPSKPSSAPVQGRHILTPSASSAGRVSAEQPVEDVSRDSSLDGFADDRLVITYACNKCSKSFAALQLFKLHVCVHSTEVVAGGAGAAASAPSAGSQACSLCGDPDHSGRSCGDHAEPTTLISALRRSNGGSGLANGSAYVCSMCGYHGNTVRGMRLHGRYHIDRGELWSEVCIIESRMRYSASPAASGSAICAQSSPNAEEELLRMKNEPYKKRKSRKSYQLSYGVAGVSPAAHGAAAAAAADASIVSQFMTSHSLGDARADSPGREPLPGRESSLPGHARGSPASVTMAVDAGDSLVSTTRSESSAASPLLPLKPVNSIPASQADDGSIDPKSSAAVIKVKTEPSSEEALASVGQANNENRQSLATPKRHICSHCNIGFMYPSSFDAHVKFYCPSSRAAAVSAATN